MQFQLGSIPVRIHGYFFIMAAVLGASERDPVRLLLWVAVVLVSILVHELGHALVGRMFGLAPSIALHGMGGTTSFQPLPGRAPRGSFGTMKNVLISLAGPFAGFAFAGALYAAELGGLIHTDNALVRRAFSLLLAVNVGWGIFNLLPMLPLDGGNVMRALARALTWRHGDRIAHVVSLVIAAGIALYALSRGQWWSVYLGGLFAFQNFQALRQLQSTPPAERAVR